MGPPGDFGLAVLILKVLEAWELVKGVYIKNTGHKKNHENFKILFWSRESEKPMFRIFPEIFTGKIWNAGISSETTIPGISSETVAPLYIPLGSPKCLLPQRAPAQISDRPTEYCCNSIVATVLLQQYCFNSTVATVLLQQYCCKSTVAIVLLQQYCCNSTVATVVHDIKIYRGNQLQPIPTTGDPFQTRFTPQNNFCFDLFPPFLTFVRLM